MGIRVFMVSLNMTDCVFPFGWCAADTEGRRAVGDAGLIAAVSVQCPSLKGKQEVTILLLF